MYNITLLSSFHIVLGKCNPAELYKIIEEIQPEIIFEELPNDYFDTIYADLYCPGSIEAIAIKEYLKKYPIKHFPVDTYHFNESDLSNWADEIAKNSPEYVSIFNKNLSLIKNNGYNFLNSIACIELLDDLGKIEKTVLAEINETNLTNEYISECELHNKREFEMLRNIYNYSKLIPYNKALFICGAEHRKAIMQKIQENENKKNIKLNWTFYNN